MVALTTDQVANLTTLQVAALTTKQIVAMETVDLVVLTTDQLVGLKTALQSFRTAFLHGLIQRPSARPCSWPLIRS
jgi:hypothetical protein